MSPFNNRPIHLPRSPAAEGQRPAATKRRRRRRSPLQQFLIGLGLVVLGGAVLVGLLFLPARLDTLLLVSTAISNLIGGLSRLALALLQFVGLILLVALALAALLALLAGFIRMGKAFLPVLGSTAGQSGPGRHPSRKDNNG
ncbi:MAG: hypothetical protein R6W06_12445 [Prochlorococcaceae cyanobacterium]